MRTICLNQETHYLQRGGDRKRNRISNGGRSLLYGLINPPIEQSINGCDRVTNGVDEASLGKVIDEASRHHLVPVVLRINHHGLRGGRAPAEGQAVSHMHELKERST